MSLIFLNIIPYRNNFQAVSITYVDESIGMY